MPRKSSKKTLAKQPARKLSKDQAKLEKTKKEVLERGSKHKKPIMLAKRRVVKLTLSILAAVIALFIIVIGLLIYVGKNDSAVVYRVSQIIPYPAARVNGRMVDYADYLFEVRYRKNVYTNPTGPASASQQPVDFKSDEGKKLLKDLRASAIKRAKAKAVIKQLADEKNISVDHQELQSGMDQLIERQGGRDKFISAINQFYGWNLKDFENEYKLQLLQQKLELIVLPEVSGEQRKQAEAILAKARQKGQDFAKLAKASSQDPGSKDKGGDLGYVNASTPFVEEFKTAALALKPGQISDIVVSRFGFHIIKATSQKGQEIRVSHILIPFAKDMEGYLQTKLVEAKVTNFVNIDESVPQPETGQPQTQPQSTQ